MFATSVEDLLNMADSKFWAVIYDCMHDCINLYMGTKTIQ